MRYFVVDPSAKRRSCEEVKPNDSSFSWSGNMETEVEGREPPRQASSEDPFSEHTSEPSIEENECTALVLDNRAQYNGGLRANTGCGDGKVGIKDARTTRPRTSRRRETW